MYCKACDLSGDEGNRTPDLGIANAALSQLSYIPTSVWLSYQIRAIRSIEKHLDSLQSDRGNSVQQANIFTSGFEICYFRGANWFAGVIFIGILGCSLNVLISGGYL